MTTVLVCGGRDFHFSDHYASIFHEIVGKRGATLIIHGAAPGADTEAGLLARGRGLAVRTFPAQWKKYGPAAGPIRNARMLEMSPDLVLAFPGGKGTANMVKLAREAGVEVIEISA